MICHRLLSDLTIPELKTVFVRTGRRGAFMESSAIIQLTIYLVKIGQDPFTYRFPISVPEDSDSNATVNKKAEVSNFHVQYATDDAKIVPEFECSKYSTVLADGVSAGVGSRDIKECGSTETEESLYEAQEISEYEEFLASSHSELADGLSADSIIVLSSECFPVSSSELSESSSETKLPSSSPFDSLSKASLETRIARHEDISSESSVWTELSHRSIMCLKIIETSGTGREDEYFVLHPTLWPPDFVSFRFLGKKFSCLQCLGL